MREGGQRGGLWSLWLEWGYLDMWALGLLVDWLGGLVLVLECGNAIDASEVAGSCG